MSAHRSIRKPVPFPANVVPESMFYNYSPPVSLIYHQKGLRSPLVEDTEVKSPDFVWEAEYQDKMPVLENAISQVPSSERRQINFQFIDDMKATFDFKSMHNKKKRSTGAKETPSDNKAGSKKDRKSAAKLPDTNKKRRPRNAFILYRTVLQAKAEFKGKTQTELSRLIAICWQKEPPETRARFERAAELEKAFGYGATDVFNIRVGPQEKEWDAEPDVPEQTSQVQSVSEFDEPRFDSSQNPALSPPINYPMYIPPFSPQFEPAQHDPYQVQATFQMLGSPYTDSPVYAGTPCGQINLSPQQPIFPFSTYPLESTGDQNGPMSPQEYGRSQATYFSNSLDTASGTMSASESFALHTTPPDVSDIPTDHYAGFDGYQVNYATPSRQDEAQSVTTPYSTNLSNQGNFQSFETNPDAFTQSYHGTDPQGTENAMSPPETSLYMQGQHQYSLANQNHLEDFIGLSGQMFADNPENLVAHGARNY